VWKSGIKFLPSDPGQPGEVAVSTSEGAIVFRLKPCKDEANARVRSVTLEGAIGEPNEGLVVWEESSDQGSTVRDYRVGQITAGFVEKVPLTDIDPNSRYVVKVIPSYWPSGLITSFVPSELRQDMWEVSTGPVSQDELEKMDPCA